MTTAASIVNQALELVARNVQVTGVNPTFDGTPAGDAAGVLYTPTLNLLLRQLDPDFARARTGPAPAGLPVINSPWAYAYLYPGSCLRARQIAPHPGSYNILDPQPIRGEVAWDTQGKVILTDLGPTIVLVQTTSFVAEDQFDPGFIEAFARRLANPLAMALGGRPDFARELLDEAERYAGYAELTGEL